MKRLLLVLLLALPCFGGHNMTILKTAGGAAAHCVTYACEVEETFEATDTNACDSGYSDVAWTVALSTADCNYATSPAPLVGSYSLELVGDSGEIGTMKATWSNSSEDIVYASAILNRTNAINLYQYPFYIMDSSTGKLCGFETTGSGGDVWVQEKDWSESTGSSFTSATTWYIKLKYDRNGGTANCSGWVTTSTDSWGTEYNETLGSASNYGEMIYMSARNLQENIYDKIIVSYDDIAITEYQ